MSGDRRSSPCDIQAVLIAILAISISSAAMQRMSPANAFERSKERRRSLAAMHAGSKSRSRPQCQTKGKEEITVTCNYTATSRSARNDKHNSRVAISRAILSFKPDDASNLRAELTFTNIGTKRISDAPTVYLAIDDDAGNNYVRRILPSVDFRRLAPGKSLTFSEELRIAAFPPGHYRIQLWIPDPEASRKFNAAHNFLLSSAGVPNSATRLNILADFTVGRSGE